jgi:hypothetical protein
MATDAVRYAMRRSKMCTSPASSQAPTRPWTPRPIHVAHCTNYTLTAREGLVAASSTHTTREALAEAALVKGGASGLDFAGKCDSWVSHSFGCDEGEEGTLDQCLHINLQEHMDT